MQEVDLSGTVVKQIDLDTLNARLSAAGMNYTAVTIHHDVAVLPNGHWIVIVKTRPANSRTFRATQERLSRF